MMSVEMEGAGLRVFAMSLAFISVLTYIHHIHILNAASSFKKILYRLEYTTQVPLD